MKKFLSLSLLALTLMLPGCATHPVKMLTVPPANRLEVLKNLTSLPQNETEELAKNYLLAMIAETNNENRTACNLFTDLSKKSNFPLNDLALVHTMANCDFSSSELENFWEDTKISNYLKEFFSELSLKLAIQHNLLKYEAQFSYESISFKKIQSEKVELIKRAIEIAKTIGDNENLKKYNNKLIEISPLHNTEITNQNIYSIAKDFEVNRQFIKARELYQQIIRSDFSTKEKVKAFNALRISHKVERNLKLFLDKTFEMEKFLNTLRHSNPSEENNEAWSDSVIGLARAVWTDHRNNEAQKILDNFLMAKVGSPNQLATVYWLYGSLNLENKESIKALKYFEEAGKIKITDLSLQENIQWAIIWNNYLLKKNNEVILSAEKFATKSKNSNFINKLNFWKGKACLKLHKMEEAKIIFKNLHDADPFGYYGILSTLDLGITLKPLSKTQIDTTPTGNQILDWLIAMNEKKYAEKYLREIDSQFKTPKERERAMSLYAQTEWYQGGMRQIYNFSNSTKNAMTEKYINIVFPTPYLDLISTFGSTYNVPMELVFGITRQESAFIASERSWADAFGLMQLIPEKAVELANKYSIPYNDYNDLYNPEINLEMGTSLLKDLREKFDGKFAQSTAAYNASEDVIKVWERERFNGNYLEFIEMIPYEETRNYIKLVFRNYITYKRILNSQQFLLDKDFFAKPF